MLAQDFLRIDLNRGVPPNDAIPSTDLSAIAIGLVEHRPELFQYAPIGGYLGDAELRAEIAAFHGVGSDEGIFVSNGSLQVLDLVAGLLLETGPRTVLVEAPTYDRAMAIFAAHGGELVGIPLDADGPDPEQLEQALKRHRAAFFYTIPDFQNPTGVTMSLARRQAILEITQAHGVTVIEDIPYRELRYAGEPQPPLGTMAAGAHVITIGSMSKILAPGLRIGYALTDPVTAARLARRAENIYLSPAPICQAIAAQAFATGLVERNIVELRRLFAPRCRAAGRTARALFGDDLFAEPEGGYFLSLRVRGNFSETALRGEADAAGLTLSSGDAFLPAADRAERARFLRIPFHGSDPAEFEAGLRRLAATMTLLDG